MSADPEPAAYRPGGPIVLAPYDPRWGREFTAESGRVKAALGDVLLEIHHVGSTAVLGLVAKPVIDMLALVAKVDELDARPDALAGLGYEALGEFGLPGRRYFRKDDAGGMRRFQIHAFETDSPEVRRHVDFRDFLRAHPEVAQEYADLKRRLAAQFPADIERYTEGKTDFIRAIERRARGEDR